jgi:PQQ-like domain
VTTPENPQDRDCGSEAIPQIPPDLTVPSFQMGRSRHLRLKGTRVVVLLSLLIVLAAVGLGLAMSVEPAKATIGAIPDDAGPGNQKPADPQHSKSSSQRPVSMGSLRIIGGPVAADGRILVLDVTSSKQMELSAIDPTSETVSWQLPFSPSAIVAGVPFAPQVFGDLVIDLDPVSGSGSQSVSVEGVDIATGHVSWTYALSGVTSDPPFPCGPQQTVCLSFNSIGTQSLVEIGATDGAEIHNILGVQQDIGKNLYAGNQNPLSLLQIGSGGQVLWQKAASVIFGKTNDDASNGFQVDPLGSVDVGSLGPASASAQSYPIGASTTTGFSVSDGREIWTDPGQYNCMGALEIFSTPVICRFKGVAHPSGSGGYSTAGITVTLEGFKAETGKINWSQPDSNVAQLVGRDPLPFVDGNDVVITQHGRQEILDLADGKVRAITAGETFWCAGPTSLNVEAPSGSYPGGQRVGTDQFYGCNAAGKVVPATPPKHPGFVGVSLDGKFFWSSPQGLRAVPSS